jgi:hypothetical protein
VVDEGSKPELRLRVLIFNDNANLPEADGELVIENHVTADDFARAVQKVGSADDLYETAR